MPKTLNLNVRISGTLKDYVAREISEGAYENMSEYVRDLIRRDQERAEEQAFQALKAELQLGFQAQDSEFNAVDARKIQKLAAQQRTQ